MSFVFSTRWRSPQKLVRRTQPPYVFDEIFLFHFSLFGNRVNISVWGPSIFSVVVVALFVSPQKTHLIVIWYHSCVLIQHDRKTYFHDGTPHQDLKRLLLLHISPPFMPKRFFCLFTGSFSGNQQGKSPATLSASLTTVVLLSPVKTPLGGGRGIKVIA